MAARLNAFMAIEGIRRWPSADAAEPLLAKGKGQRSAPWRALAHKDMYYEPARCDLRLENRRDFVPDDLDRLKRLKDAGRFVWARCRCRNSAYGPTGHTRIRGGHNPWHCINNRGSSSGSGAAVAARLTLRHWAPTRGSIGCPRISAA